jgi:predicted DNA-binding ribbon-helix-helix protein
MTSGGVGHDVRLRITASRHLDTHQRMRDRHGMRTTLQIDDDVYRAARSLAASESVGIGTVISRLARKGLEPAARPRRTKGGFPTFTVSPGSQVITPEMVKQAAEEP